MIPVRLNGNGLLFCLLGVIGNMWWYWFYYFVYVSKDVVFLSQNYYSLSYLRLCRIMQDVEK